MDLVLAASTAYRLGEYAGLVMLLVVFVWCVRRAMNETGQKATDRPASSPAPASAAPAFLVAEGSVAPPGYAPGPAMGHLPSRAVEPAETRTRAVHRRYAIGAVAALVLLVGGTLHITGNGSSSPWATQAGIDVKAGFLNGCTTSASGVVDCQCVFAHLASQPPYNTPQGFESLGSNVLAYERTGDRTAIPAVYISSLQACRIHN